MSRDFFNEAAKNTVELQKQIIPETYKYYKFIRTPKEMGMSTKGGMKDLQDNVAALVSYGELLISGGGAAVEGDQSLGNRYFLKTGGQCNANGSVVDRYVYVDNLPHGGIPMSDNTFIKYQKFRGIIPGMLQDIEDINTAKLFRGFMEEEHPTCRDMTLETIDVNNARAMQTRHIADSDIREMNACSFPSRKNPITGVTCGTPPNRPPLKDQILARTNFGGHIDPACGPAADAAAATHPHVLHHPGGINEASGAGAVTPPDQIQTAVQSAGAPGTSSSVAGGGGGDDECL